MSCTLDEERILPNDLEGELTLSRDLRRIEVEYCVSKWLSSVSCLSPDFVPYAIHFPVHQKTTAFIQRLPTDCYAGIEWRVFFFPSVIPRTSVT